MCVCVCVCSVLHPSSTQHRGLGSLMHSLHNWDPVWKLQRVFSGRLFLPPAVSGARPAGKYLPLPSLANFRELPRRFPLFALSFTVQAPHTAGKYSEHQGKKWPRYEQRRHGESKCRCANTCSVKRMYLGMVLEIIYLGQQFRYPKNTLWNMGSRGMGMRQQSTSEWASAVRIL